MCRQWLLCIGVALLSASSWSTAAGAQELTPRAYWPAPKGAKAIVFGYQYSTGAPRSCVSVEGDLS